MLWIISIGLCIAIWLLFNHGQTIQRRKLIFEMVPEMVAREYLERPKGETISQIKAALYRHYCIAEPGDWFKPVPFGNLVLGMYVKEMPEDALSLGEIAYTILFNKGVYPTPQENQGLRDGALG